MNTNRMLHLIFIFIPFLFITGCGNQRISDKNMQSYVSAKNLYERGKLEMAEAALRPIISETPRFYQCRFLLAKSLFFQNKLKEAEEELGIILRAEPRYREAELLYIRLLIRNKEYRKADGEIDRLLSYDSDDPRLLYLKALTAEYQNKTDETLLYLKKAEIFSEEFARVFLDLGRIYYIFGLPAEAEGYLHKALHLIPRESALYNPVIQLIETVTEKE